MGGAQPRPDRPRPISRWRIAGALLAASAVAAAVVWVFVWLGRSSLPPPAQPEDPRVTYGGPYLNVHPEVRYVGDDRCTDCHRDIAESYHKHPMARTLAPIAQLAPSQSYDAAQNNPFEAFGSVFQVERRGDAVSHRQTRVDDAGRLLLKTSWTSNTPLAPASTACPT
jgi:hypothetical protein